MNEWPIKRLADICSIEIGRTPARANKKYWDDKKTTGNVWVSIADMRDDITIINTSKEHLSDAGAAITPIVPEGALLLSFKLSLGKLAFAGKSLRTNEAIAALIPNDKRALEPKFLYWYLRSFDWAKASRGSEKIKGATLNKAKLKEIPIPFPPLAEQKRIVAFLDEAFNRIAQASVNADRNLSNADELFDSELQTLIDHAEDQAREVSFADVCDITSSLVDPKLEEFQNFLHVGGGNMVTKSDNLVDLKTAKEEKLISGKFLFDESMVLYSKIRPYLMKVSRPDFSGLCSADVYPLSPRKNILDRDYLFFVLLSKKFTEYAISGSGRAGMPKVNRNHLFAYTLKVPSLSVQKEIVQKLNQTMDARDKLKDLYQKKQTALNELKTALLDQAFSGKLKSKEVEAA